MGELGAPPAAGPYSHAVRTGNILYCSGQVPICPKEGEIIAHDIESLNVSNAAAVALYELVRT